MRFPLNAVMVLATAAPVWACRCSKLFDPCSMLPPASDVVVSEVIIDTGWLSVAAVRVVEVLKGEMRVGDVALTIGGTSPRLPPGTRLLQFRARGDYFRIDCCGPSYAVSHYGHWLRGLKNRLRGGAPMVMGDVWGWGEGPLAGVRVSAQCGGRRGSATTNALGQWVIEGLEPGPCEVRLEKPGYRDEGIWASREFVLGDGCGWALSHMKTGAQ